MYFPDDVIVEVAFSNDIDEAQYAQSGYTDITSFVRRINGTLRGRQYEIGQAEAGTLTVALDNTDRRFSMATPTSPYFPNVKPARRFRIRGKNMVHPNVARSGSRDEDTTGLVVPDGITASVEDNDGLTGLPEESWTQPGQAADLSHHFELSVTGGVSGENILAQWYVPLEYGVRLTHSAYVWKVSGTAPASSDLRLDLRYFGSDDLEVGTLDGGDPTVRPVAGSGIPTTPTRVAVSHAPLGTAKYALATLYVNYGSAPTGTQVYALAAVQSELPANLAPDVSGLLDVNQWQVSGSGEAEQYSGSDNAVQVTWAADDVSAFIDIPHLVPGDDYAVALELKVVSGPSIDVSLDDGRTVVNVSSSTYQTVQLRFTAAKPEQQLKFFTNTPPADGDQIRIRLLNVQRSDVDISPASSAGETGETDWQRPYDIFEGWTEDWPLRADRPNEVVITVVDRIKRLGSIILAHPFKEIVGRMKPDLWLPLDDDTTQTGGTFAQLGAWGEGEFTTVELVAGDGGPSTGTYTSDGVVNMIGDAALKLTTAPTQGYLFHINRDIGEVPTEPTAPTQPKPPPPTTTKRRYRYTKTYYATWSRSFDGSGDTRYNDPPTMYHGQYDSFNGNQRSMIGFNYNQIRKDLAGAEIITVGLTLKGEHAGRNTGIANLRIGTHNASSKPSSFSGTTGRWTSSIGETQQKTFGLGVTPGNQLKAGTIKGFVIGPASNTSAANYGYLRGATQSGRPYLTIVYDVWR